MADPGGRAALSGMLFEDLQAFLTVARLRSFSAAAARLRVAQSSLSKRVGRLEHHFGVALLRRHARGAEPTEPGALLLARAEHLVAELHNVERDMRSVLGQAVGTVRLALPPATSPELAPRIFDDCRQHHPDITLQLRESTSESIHDWLSDGEVDIALMYNPELGATFEIQPLILEPLYLIAPARERLTGLAPDYPDHYRLRDLAELPLILPRRPHSIRVLVERLCAAEGVSPNVLFESDSIRSTKGIVERGLGCTIFSRTWLRTELGSDRLRAIPFSSALLNWKLCIAYTRRHDTSLAMHTVRQRVQAHVEALFHEGFWHDAHWIGPDPSGSTARD